MNLAVGLSWGAMAVQALLTRISQLVDPAVSFIRWKSARKIHRTIILGAYVSRSLSGQSQRRAQEQLSCVQQAAHLDLCY